uniref:Transposase Tc1-like domain-containing protein n=1 Tax=Amphiprion ocellaris TaxID=80972 RepID=A0A3Q1C858_AMPOC
MTMYTNLLPVRNHPQTSRDLKNEWILWRNGTCSARTVGKRLVEAGLKSHGAGRSPSSRKGRGKLVTLCWDHKDWTADDWTKVLFRDESSFQLMSTPANFLVRRKPGEATNQTVCPYSKTWGGSVTIWGSFSLDGTGTMNQGMYRATLENSLLPSAGKLFPAFNDWIFQQDNVPYYTASIVFIPLGFIENDCGCLGSLTCTFLTPS